MGVGIISCKLPVAG